MLNNWVFYSLLAAIFLSTSFLLVKKASLTSVPVAVLTLYMWGLATIGLLGYLLFSRQDIRLPMFNFEIIVLVALTFLFGSLFVNKGIYLAPNPGFVIAVCSVQILIVSLASAFLFNSGFSAIKILGSASIIIGVILLSL